MDGSQIIKPRAGSYRLAENLENRGRRYKADDKHQDKGQIKAGLSSLTILRTKPGYYSINNDFLTSKRHFLTILKAP